MLFALHRCITQRFSWLSPLSRSVGPVCCVQIEFSSRTSKLSSACTVGFFGSSSEFCQPCYSGATCSGGAREPISIPGFFIGNLSLETRSDPCLHATRARCLAPRPCDPPESCIGRSCWFFLAVIPSKLTACERASVNVAVVSLVCTLAVQATTCARLHTRARHPCIGARHAPRASTAWRASVASAPTTRGSWWCHSLWWSSPQLLLGQLIPLVGHVQVARTREAAFPRSALACSCLHDCFVLSLSGMC